MSNIECEAHEPLFQYDEPIIKYWFCPKSLPWVCLQVCGVGKDPCLWVWFQVRTVAPRTVLHQSTIEALGFPSSVLALNHTIPVISWDNINLKEETVNPLGVHINHNVAGLNLFNRFHFLGVESCSIDWQTKKEK